VLVTPISLRFCSGEGTLVRYNGKHLADNNSQYQTNIVLQLSDNETIKNATNAFNSFSFLTHSSFICIPAINGLGASCFHRLSAISIDFYLIKVKLEKVHGFVQSRIENPFISSLIDTMDKSKYGSDIDKKLEMLEGMKSELDAYQENQSKYEPAARQECCTLCNNTVIF
jgi:hypothetical protein